jgi:hypothetical protein
MVMLLELPKRLPSSIKRLETLLIVIARDLSESVELALEPLLHRTLESLKEVASGAPLIRLPLVHDDASQSPGYVLPDRQENLPNLQLRLPSEPLLDGVILYVNISALASQDGSRPLPDN